MPGSIQRGHAPVEPAEAVVSGGLSLPPGPKGRRLRNLRDRILSFREFMGWLHDQYGDIVFYRIPGQDCCAVFDAERIHEFMSERHSSFPPFQDESSYGIMKTPGVFRTRGETHRALHGVIDEAFDRERMPFHVEVMLEHVRAMTESWRGKEVLDARDEMNRLVTAVMQDSIFGRDTRINAAMAMEAVWALKYDWALRRIPVRTAWLKALPIPQNRRCREAIRAIDDVIYGAIRRARGSPGRGDDVISLLVQASERGDLKNLGVLDTDEKIRDEVYTIALGNTDAPTNAAVFVIYELSRNPAVRGRLEEEADGVLGDGRLTAADFERLPYARAVFQETMRVQPPAYAGTAQLRVAEEDCVLGGYRVPAGTMIHPCVGIPHRKAEYWDSPMEFRPERWLSDAGPGVRDCPARAYMPFGLEPRRCPGDGYTTMLLVFAMASFTRSFRLDPVSGEPPEREALGVGVKGPYPVTVARRGRDAGKPGQ